MPFALQEGHILTRNHGNPDVKDTPPQFPLVQNQCIDYERFKPLFEFLTNWGTGEIGSILAQRAFKVSKQYIMTVGAYQLCKEANLRANLPNVMASLLTRINNMACR